MYKMKFVILHTNFKKETNENYNLLHANFHCVCKRSIHVGKN